MTPPATTPAEGCAWITGASSGIGRALALELARRGWTVAATARGGDALNALTAESTGLKGRIVAMPGDVTDEAAMDRMVAEIENALGPVALAVLNAGIYLPVDGLAMQVEDFRRSFDVNLNGTVHCLVPVSARMLARRRGQVALVASVTGYGGLPTSAAYGATKAALINMAESLKFDFDRRGVRLQIVCPGFVETPATAENPFPMPFLMKVEAAAKRIADGLTHAGFEITFPRRFTFQLKALRLLPYRAYFALVGRQTGWAKKP